MKTVISGRPLPDMPHVEHRHISVRGARLHVAESGSGEPLLMLHGFPQHWYAWRHLIPALRDRYRVLCPDFRGFGWSEATGRGYTTADRVADMLGLLDALGIEQAQLMGHDWGAYTGFHLCLRQPRRFGSFVALNMVHPWPTHRRLLTNAWRFWYTAVLEYPYVGAYVLRRWPAFARHLLTRGVANPDVWQGSGRRALAEFVEASAMPGSAHAGQALHWGFVLHDIPALSLGWFHDRWLTVPTLVITGARDVVVPPPLVTAAPSQAPGLRVQTLPGVGHFAPDEAPGLVADLALRHLGG